MQTVQRACNTATELDAAKQRHPSARRRGPLPEPRLPMEPLIRLIELHEGRQVPITEIATIIGAGRSGRGMVHLAIRKGVTAFCADRWSIAAGFHPALVWGIDWYEGGEAA
ncbi:MAG: hypothetical protein JWN99_385 [Ilumatobacteraceae bacterium]|nr:hypothetical protein [Ilumatobacteraceae bacterium]